MIFIYLNGHINFIYSFSNIIATNFNIKEKKQKVKITSGKIVLAMVTTTGITTDISHIYLYNIKWTEKRYSTKFNFLG